MEDGGAVRRRGLAAALAAAEREAARSEAVAVDLLRRIEYTLRGPYLEGRGLRAGDRLRVAPGPVRPGGLTLVAAGDGRLAAGVAVFDAGGGLSVWSDWRGPPVELCHCEAVWAIGPLEAYRPLCPAPPGSRLEAALTA